MTRMTIERDTLRALFARSGNKCAFPGCPAVLVNEKNQFIAQVCHIEAAGPGGPRYNPVQTDEERRHYNNLIILCYPHHIETDSEEEYPPARLHGLKLDHEAAQSRNQFKIDESLLYKIVHEMAAYWKQVDHLHRLHHVASDFAIPIDVAAPFMVLADQVYKLLDLLREYRDCIQEGDNELEKRLPKFIDEIRRGDIDENHYRDQLFRLSNPNWEILNLGVTNALGELGLRILQMEVLYLEEFLKTRGGDSVARARLDAVKLQFAELATTSGYAD